MESIYVTMGCYALLIATSIFFFIRLDSNVSNLLKKTNFIISQNIKIMNTQDEINQIVAAVAADLTGISGDITSIAGNVGSMSDSLAKLIAAAQGGQPLDLTALQALQAQADAAKSGLDQVAASAATAAQNAATAANPPASTPAPASGSAPADATGAGSGTAAPAGPTGSN